MRPRPTNVRFLVVVVTMLAAVLLYLERVCVGVADVYIRQDLRIGKTEMNAAFGAFFFAYALGQVPAGWLSQRYGPRRMLTLYILGWAVFGAFIALAQDFWTLFLARFLLGLSQAGAYPTAALLVKRWVPDRARGAASSVVAFGGRFGGAGANWLTGVLIVTFVPISVPSALDPADVLDVRLFIQQLVSDEPADLQLVKQQVRAVLPPRDVGPESIAKAVNVVIRNPGTLNRLDWIHIDLPYDGRQVQFKSPSEITPEEAERLNRLVVEKTFPGSIRQLHVGGWRPALLTYAALGLAAAALFWLVVRDWPYKHPWANPAEVALIESGQSQESQRAGTDAVPWRELATSRNHWLYSATNFFSNLGWVFLITLMPRFLDERFAVPVDLRGLMTTVPLFVGCFGLLAGGWYTDRLSRTVGRQWGRAVPMGAFKLPCVAAAAVCPFLGDAWAVVLMLTAMAFFQDFGNPAVWAFAQDTGGRQPATVLGWANMWGNFGAGIGPLLIGDIVGRFGWDAALYAVAAAFALCFVVGMLTNADEPLFRPAGENP
jgi:MFS family permease